MQVAEGLFATERLKHELLTTVALLLRQAPQAPLGSTSKQAASLDEPEESEQPVLTRQW